MNKTATEFSQSWESRELKWRGVVIITKTHQTDKTLWCSFETANAVEIFLETPLISVNWGITLNADNRYRRWRITGARRIPWIIGFSRFLRVILSHFLVTLHRAETEHFPQSARSAVTRHIAPYMSMRSVVVDGFNYSWIDCCVNVVLFRCGGVATRELSGLTPLSNQSVDEKAYWPVIRPIKCHSTSENWMNWYIQ